MSPRFSVLLCAAVVLSSNALPAATAAEPAVDPVARIGSLLISQKDLSTRTVDKMAEQQTSYEKALLQMRMKLARQQHALREAELAQLVDERVLGLEASARKTTADALLSGIKPAAVTDATTRAFYDENQAQIGQPYDAIKDRIQEYLQKQAQETAKTTYLGSLRAKYHAVILLEPLRETVPTTGPDTGPPDAPVTMVEFSDFQCPFCGRFAPVVKQVMAKYPGKIRLVYHHMPLTGLHPNAQKAAEAAVCAQDQGKFWPMHDLLFAEQSALGVDALKEKAKRLELDSARFDDCLDNGKSKDAVAADVKAGEALGIGGTPASFINGRFVDGALSAADLGAIIEDELQRRAPAARR